MLSATDAAFFGTVLEALFYGVYCVIFTLYIQLRFHKDSKERSFLLYPLLALFILCTVFFSLDVAQEYLFTLHGTPSTITAIWDLNVTTTCIYGFIDIISQFILIYRCFVIWGRNTRVVIVPSFLAVVSFASSMTIIGVLATHTPSFDFFPSLPSWYPTVGTAFFSISLGVNTIVTGLIVIKLFQLHREATETAGITNMTNIRPIISMLIESGTPMFAAQLICVVMVVLESPAFGVFSTLIAMVFGMTPTLIIVRVSMRTNENRNTMEAAGISDIHFIFPPRSAAMDAEKGGVVSTYASDSQQGSNDRSQGTLYD